MINIKPDINGVFERICELYRLDGDTAIGEFLEISNQNVYQYRKRGTMPWPHIIQKCPPKDWEYIFAGSKAAPSHAEISMEDVKRASKAIREALKGKLLEGEKIDLAVALTARSLAIQRALADPNLDIEASLKADADQTVHLLG